MEPEVPGSDSEFNMPETEDLQVSGKDRDELPETGKV
jgi:hypothetical protein